MPRENWFEAVGGRKSPKEAGLERGDHVLAIDLVGPSMALQILSGMTPQVDADFLKLSEEQAENLQAQIIREFNLWADSPMCDADQTDDFWKLQMLAFEGYLMNGDSFAIMPYSKPKSWQQARMVR